LVSIYRQRMIRKHNILGGYQNMAVGIESEEVAKGLDGDDGAG